MLTRRQLLLSASGALAAFPTRYLLRGAETADVQPLEERIAALVGDARLSMKFTGSTDDECRRWQAAFAGKLRELLGPFTPPAKWECRLERVVQLDDHTREERVLVAANVPPVPVHVLLPKESSSKPRAAMLAVHGHGLSGHDGVAGRDDIPEIQDEITKVNYGFGRELARRGYVVACPCLTPFGRRLCADVVERKRIMRNPDPCIDAFMRLLFVGKLLMAENLRDLVWTLDYLTSRSDVDPQRLGCAGMSYGGRMAMLVTALDPRIRVATISGALNCYQERASKHYACGSQTIPGLLEFGDTPEIGSLIAPRPCLWEAGKNDGNMPVVWIERFWERASRAYSALDAADQLKLDHHDGGHQWHGELAYPWLDHVLRPNAKPVELLPAGSR